MVCPPEKHISVETSDLLNAIKNRLHLEQRASFEELAKLMAVVGEFDFFDLKLRMRRDFLPFASGSRNEVSECCV